MRWSTAWGLVVLLLLAPLSVHADSGRDAPTCASASVQSLPPTLDVDDGACTTVDLGLLQPGDVYAMSIIVVDDAIDVLKVRLAGIQLLDTAVNDNSELREIPLQVIYPVVIKRRDLAVLSRRETLQPGLARVHNEHRGTARSHRTHKIDEFRVTLLVINADAMLHGDGDVAGGAHCRDAVAH